MAAAHHEAAKANIDAAAHHIGQASATAPDDSTSSDGGGSSSDSDSRSAPSRGRAAMPQPGSVNARTLAAMRPKS